MLDESLGVLYPLTSSSYVDLRNVDGDEQFCDLGDKFISDVLWWICDEFVVDNVDDNDDDDTDEWKCDEFNENCRDKNALSLLL